MTIRYYPCDGCGKLLPMGLDISDGHGSGTAAWKAGRALAYCECCWNSFCIDCNGCENHRGTHHDH